MGAPFSQTRASLWSNPKKKTQKKKKTPSLVFQSEIHRRKSLRWYTIRALSAGSAAHTWPNISARGRVFTCYAHGMFTGLVSGRVLE